MAESKIKNNQITIYAKLMSGDIIPLEMNKRDNVKHLYSNIYEILKPAHENLIQVFLNGNDIKSEKKSMLCEILDNMDTIDVFINKPVVKLFDAEQKVDLYIDNIKYRFTEYSLKILAKPNLIYIRELNMNQIQGTNFWYNHDLGMYCETINGEFETNIYASGLMTKDWKELFQAIIPEKWKEFVLDNFNYNELVSNKVDTLYSL
jgi:hypothetical protein